MEIIPDNNDSLKDPRQEERNEELLENRIENEREVIEEIEVSEVKEKSSDEAWADSLGLKFDAEEAARRTPPPIPTTPTPPPPYNYNRMNQGMPPVNHGNNPGMANGWQETEPMPKSYMLWSILSVVFCCFIPGIVAIVYSAQVSSKYYAKDYEGARRASDRAQAWIIASIVLGVISAAFYLPLSLMGS